MTGPDVIRKGEIKLFTPVEVAIALLILFSIHLTSYYNYLLFHSLAEFFSIFVAATIFVIAVNSWRLISNQYLIFIGISYAFIALLDTLHTLSYTGMGVFKDYNYYAPQFWVASRGMESISMLIAFAFLGSRFRLRLRYLIAAFSIITALLIASILIFKIFPVCFIPGKGLTPFKVYSEYVIIALFLSSLYLLSRKRAMFDSRVFWLLATSLILMATMEFCFTLYYSNSMSDIANEIGHLLKIAAFYFFYKAIVVTGIRDPISLLFRDLKEKEAQLIKSEKRAMFYDPITGLPNRRLFLDRLGREIKESNVSGKSLCLLYIDIDRFKEINDSLGHEKGDEVLAQVARRLHSCLRESDILAHPGGDEFMLILPDYGQRTTINSTVHCILEMLAKPFDLGMEESARTSGSIGIVCYPEDAQSLDALLQYADQALDAAKAVGRNSFSYFTSSMQQEAMEKIKLTNDLRQALERKELEVYFQPIIEAASNQIVKAEALLRWHHPERGMISPALFIPLAEESGTILEIGEWVFSESIRCMKHWKEVTGKEIQVSVNKSPVQFMRGKQDLWLEKLADAGLPGSAITIEITEGLLLEDSDKVKNELLDYQHRGIEVSIDDFGTGFSALSYLIHFSIDYLKIDYSFIFDITANDSNRALTEAIIVMAHKLGIKTIAEGVETKEQRDLLLTLECDYLQGFLYSPPVTATAFEALLAK